MSQKNSNSPKSHRNKLLLSKKLFIFIMLAIILGFAGMLLIRISRPLPEKNRGLNPFASKDRMWTVTQRVMLMQKYDNSISDHDTTLTLSIEDVVARKWNSKIIFKTYPEKNTKCLHMVKNTVKVEDIEKIEGVILEMAKDINASVERLKSRGVEVQDIYLNGKVLSDRLEIDTGYGHSISKLEKIIKGDDTIVLKGLNSDNIIYVGDGRFSYNPSPRFSSKSKFTLDDWN